MACPLTLGVVLAAAAAGWPSVPVEEGASPAEATLARIAAYEAFLDELWLDEIPDDVPNRTAAALAVERLGDRVTELSRLAARATDQASRRQLDDELERFDRNLEQARQRARTVAIYALRLGQGVRNPTWGVALAEADVPLLPPAYEFVGKVSGALELWIERGKLARVQIVALSLGGNLAQPRARLSRVLRGPGAELPRAAVTLTPVRWRQAREDSPARMDALPETDRLRDSRAAVFLLAVDVPPETVPGLYAGVVMLSAAGREDIELPVRVTVTEPCGAEAVPGAR